MQYFWFETNALPDKSFQMDIEAWPSDENSDADIYLSKLEQGEEIKITKNYQWKANNHGKVRIFAKQMPSNNQSEKYLLAVEPMRRDTNQFKVSL